MSLYVSPILINNSSFGKSKLLNNVKEISNVVQSAFPYFSPTKYRCENRLTLLSDEKLRKSLCDIQQNIEKCREQYMSFSDKPVKFYKTLIEGINGIKAMNCAEASSLTYMSLNMNGIKNCVLAMPITANKRKIDHTVVKVITGNNDDIIVDTWLGISGYESDIIKLYNTKYCNYFELVPGEKVNFQTSEFVSLNEINIQEIKQIVPELYINKDIRKRRNIFA